MELPGPTRGATRHRFGYDDERRLLSITNVDGDVTTIERDGQGNPTAIVSPDGQRTVLALNAEGYLASVTNPMGETHAMAYTPEGLLTRFTDPKGHANRFEYDALGRLIKDTNAGEGGWTIARTNNPAGYTTAMTTGEGRASRFEVEPLSTGDRRQVNTSPDGTVETKLFKTNGEKTTTAPDGTVTTVREGPDPRFGMQAPVPGAVRVKLPSGLTSNTTTARMAAALSNPNDPFSFTRLTETVSVNGKTSTSAFNKATLTYTNTSPAGLVSATTVNDQHRPVTSQVTGLNAVNYTYDTRGRLNVVEQGAGPDQRTTLVGYNAAGYVGSLTDALNRRTTFEYDLAGRVMKQSLPDSREVNYSYDANGNLTGLTPPGRPGIHGGGPDGRVCPTARGCRHGPYPLSIQSR